MVRMRYRDNPYFLGIKTVSQNQKWTGKADLAFEFKTPRPTSNSFDLVKPGFGMTFEENPSVGYAPLEDKDFISRLLSPVQTSIVLSMIQSGWRLDRIFDICIERVNGLRNAPTASGPTPELAPEYANFRRFVELLRVLQDHDLFAIGPHPTYAFPDDMFRIKNDHRFAKEITELKALAQLDPTKTDYKIKDNFIGCKPSKLTLRCRSLMGIFFFLSQGIEVPEADETGGLVTVTKNADGSRFDWKSLSSCFFQVRCSDGASRPKDAFVAVRYRNKWFYLADNDLESKATFMLVNQIFSLQSANLRPNKSVMILK
jgi:hypothetical protein